MDISYKIILDKRRLKPSGLYPLKLRVFQNGVTKEQSLDILIREKDWNEKEQMILSSDKNYKTNIYKLNQAKNRLDKTILLQETHETLTPELLLGKLHSKSVQKTIYLRDYSNKLIQALIQAKRVGTALAYTDATNSLIKYSNEQLTLQQITFTFLEGYNTSMLRKGTKVNSIAAYLRSIRAIYNKAIKEGLALKQDYPFDAFKIETEDTFNRTLTIEQMQRFVSVPLPPHSPAWHNRNYFILSFCLVGINFTDLFTLGRSDLVNSVIHYRRDKTGKLYSITVPSLAKELFDYYSTIDSNNEHRYLLPQLRYSDSAMQQKKWIKQLCKTANKYLKRIAKECSIDVQVTTYFARYSWANIAKKLGYSKDFIAEALGHEYGNKVTGIYLDKYESEKINEANMKIIDVAFKSYKMEPNTK